MSSSGIDWASVAKSLLASINASTCDKNDILELIQVVIKAESEFKNHLPIHDSFYSCLSSLAVHFIAINAPVLSYENINIVKDGCRILLRYLLLKLEEQSKLSTDENVSHTWTIKQLLLPLVHLCGGENGGLPHAEITVLTSMIKSAELPLADKSGQTLTSISSTSSISSQDKKPSSDSSQRRVEPLIEQLTAPLLLSQSALWSTGSKSQSGAGRDSSDVMQMSQTIPDGQKVKKILNSACSQMLVSLRGSGILLQLCHSLPCLQRYLGRWHSSQESMAIPTFNSDATMLGFLVTEITISQMALSLPVYEPLTEEKVILMSDLSSSWLLCAITQASIHPKDEENEQQAAALVEGALSFFNTVGDFLKNSTRAGGYVYQNHLMIGGWILLCGLHHSLVGAPGVPSPGPISMTQGRSPAKTLSRPYNLNKIQQGGIGAVWVALGSRCLRVCGAILHDARLEVLGGFIQVPTQGLCINGAPLEVLYQGTAGERAMTLLQCAPLHQLFVTLGVVCYRKATTLKRAVAQKQYQADPDADQSDSTIYYQDMILCSEDSETDDDSEPLLGLWFESTLVAPDANEISVNNTNNAASSSNDPNNDNQDNDLNNRGIDHHTVVPDKSEPYAYIAIASEVFETLCENVAIVIDGIPGVDTISTYLSSPSLQLQDAQAALLAALIRDFDRETARTDTGTISSCFGQRLGVLYGTFSASLGRYLHTLSASPNMQNMLLQHLGVGTLPGDKSLDKPGTSPLQLGVRVLKLIGSIVLSKHPIERENAILGIWSRIVNTITECTLQWSPPADHDFEDLNVEHAQLLLYMFHSLNLMSKKVVLILTANAICKVSDSLCFSDRGRASQLPPHQLMLTTRLLLFLEYFMRHLYDAPTSLMQQIEWNLLVAPGLSQPWSTDLTTAMSLTSGSTSDAVQGMASAPSQVSASTTPTRIFCAMPEIEKDYKKMVPDDLSMRPKFYALTNIENSPNEMAKLDGLACNFVLGTDKLRYTALMDALLSLLNTVTVCDATAGASPQQLCAARYCFQTAWRLVSTMPPPKPFIERVATGRMASLPCPLPLHTALWGPRSTIKQPYYNWIKDILTKQGVFTSMAENLLKEVSDGCDNISYSAWLANKAINQLMDNVRPSSLPSLLDIISVDCVLSRLRTLLIECPPTPPPLPPTTAASAVAATTAGAPAVAASTATASSQPQASENAQLSTQFLLSLLALTEIVFECCRVSAIAELSSEVEVTNGALLEARLRLCASENPGTRSVTRALTGGAVAALEQALRWQLPQRAQHILAVIGTPLNDELTFPSGSIPSDQVMLMCVARHEAALSSSTAARSLRMLAHTAVTTLKLAAPAITQQLGADLLKNRALGILVPALLDARLECVAESCAAAINILHSSAQATEQLIHETVFRVSYPVMVEQLTPSSEKILSPMVAYWESAIHRQAGKVAFVEIFGANTNLPLSEILLTIPNARLGYSAKVVRLFNQLIVEVCESWGDRSLCIELCNGIGNTRPDRLRALMFDICQGAGGSGTALPTSPSEGELATPTGAAPATQNAQAAQPAQPASNTSSPAPQNGQSDTAQQSESCSWSGGASESSNRDPPSGGASQPPQTASNQSQGESFDATNDCASLLSNLIKHVEYHCDDRTIHALLDCLVTLVDEMFKPLPNVSLMYVPDKNATSEQRPPLPSALPHLIREMARLADAESGSGHKILFPAAVEWLATAMEILGKENTLEQVEWGYMSNGAPNAAFTALAALLESACVLLTYLTDALQAVSTPSTTQPQTQQVAAYRSISPSWETPADFSAELDWPDETQDEDDTSADDSDEDSMLNMRLCTFTVTAREFMNQHWYHCHTCSMVDGVGVCSVCARVCHRGHDVTYAKFGNFFCDCGAKEDSSCQALVKRSSSHAQTLGRGGGASATPGTAGNAATASGIVSGEADSAATASGASAPSLRRRASSPLAAAPLPPSRRPPTVAIMLEGVRSMLQSFEGWSRCIVRMAELARNLVPTLKEACAQRSPVGSLKRARTALSCLHVNHDRKFVLTDTLMVPTLGSQEGAFENVRMSYTGEQGQTIRQLIGAHMIRRVAMCCLASPLGRRQHLAVSHEKGKITVLQLSALLKQADSSKHKLTLTRLSSAPIPFTVLTLSGNAWNEDLLAVCGLKECHVLTFNSGGSVSEHIALQPGLDTGNFIIRAIWLPGTQTQLALVTADFVKIYDLSKDTISPQYHFLVPSGKVRDVTFVYRREVMHMLCMGSAGHIYWQPMNEESRATHGPFYVTNTLEVVHSENKDVAGQVGGGGVSIYYSHIMKMLFFSYAHGKSFLAPLTNMEEPLQGISMITLSGSSVQKESSSASGGSGSGTGGGSGRAGGKGGAQSLCQWQEVPGHPGLITAVLQASNNPIVLMLKPFQIGVQEIKVVPAKAKITDTVAVRHATSQMSGGEHKTTLILLCEDGSLRIYAANPENTGFWLSSAVQPVWKSPGGSSSAGAAGARGRRGTKALPNQATAKGKTPQAAAKPGANSGAPQFPIDFFEHCLVLSDVDFGGNDLLQVYNTAQVKHRLNTTGLYVASTKLSGFSMEVSNPDVCTVITGIRVLLGTQDTNRAPTYIEIFGRTIQTVLQQHRSRWFDIPLTREETLQIDKKLIVTFGPSQDPEGVVMVDSVKVYGRTKEVFGWPDENEEGIGAVGKAAGASGTAATAGGAAGMGNGDDGGSAALERLACSALEALELGVSDDLAGICELTSARETALNAAQRILCAPCTPQLHTRAKHLMHAVHGPNYHHHKDQAIMGHILDTLQELAAIEDARYIDPENFFRCALLARTIAVERPANLVKFGGTSPNAPADGDWASLWHSPSGPIPAHVMCLLAGVAWKLAHVRGPWPEGAGSAGPMHIVSYGLKHVEHSLHAVVDVVHAYQMHSPDSQMVNIGNSIYCMLLLAKDQAISFGAKNAIMRVLRPKVKKRRVYIPSPPTTPGGAGGLSGISGGIVPVAQVDDLPPPDHNDNHHHFVEVDHPLEPLAFLTQERSLEALLDIHPDADDEAMIEMAIALSLQEHANALVGEGVLAVNRVGEGVIAVNRGARAPLHVRAAAGAAVAAARGAVQRRAQPPQAPPPPPQDSSPPGSDDEGSTAATDGSTLRTSPAEAPGSGGSAGSDSGGSGAESIGGVSGRSSAYGEMVSAPSTAAVAAAAASVEGSEPAAAVDTDHEGTRDADVSSVDVASDAQRVRCLRVALLSASLVALPQLHTLAGVRAIPFMQVILMLAGDLDVSVDQDRAALEHLLEALVAELEMNKWDERSVQTTPIYEKTNRRELQLVITRLLSVLMARWKPPTTSAPSPSSATPPLGARLSRMTAAALASSDAVPHCARELKSLLDYWQSQPAVAGSPPTPAATNAPVAIAVPAAVPAALGEQLLRPHPPHPLPDMQPFFVKQYVKSHPWDVFENYPYLLTEMALRLPYQIHKLLDPPQIAKVFDKSWNTLLCEYMMNQHTPFLRKQVRKLLMLLCGGRERYRQLRDTHALDVHLNAARNLCIPVKPSPWRPKSGDDQPIGSDVPYDNLVKLMDHLKASAEMVVARTGNWQYMCINQTPTYLSWLIRAACILGDGVASALLQLVQCALCAPVQAAPPAGTSATASAVVVPASQAQKDRSERDRSADSDLSASDGSRFQESLVPQLVRQIWEQLSQDELKKFIRVFLLETNSTAVRWQAHALLLAIYNNCTDAERTTLVALLWQVWPTVPQYGRKAGQFVDLLGYFSLKTPDINNEEYLASAVELLRTQNNLLAGHGNAPLYAALANYVELDGHYLESEPCLVCNNPEVPMTTIKLSTIKIDSKFTTTTQIVKLIGSHTISRISLRISDLKRSKMVRAMNFFYNNRTVQAVQELKNKPGMWHKAKRVYLQSGQTEVRVDFPLPIVACNLMMEYADFFENQQATGESLQCPRCSASVPANPGVCSNCGENVFQCHKCRAINYDEKDPFLCHACGFCKYAKFDYTLTARQCCAVDTIENDDDRKKMVATIGTLLDKADRVYRQLVANKPVLESLIHKISEQRVEGRGGGMDDQLLGGVGGGAGGGGSSAQVNRGIQTLAHKYCVESRGHFDDLSKIIQKVLACRKELVAYDRSQSEQLQGDIPPAYTTLLHSSYSTPGKSTEPSTGCYGCALSAAEYCLTLLRALASAPKHRDRLCQLGLVKELVHHNLRRGSPQCQEEVRQLICLVTRDNLPATEALCNLLSQRITLSLMGHAATQDHSNAVRPLVVLLGALVKMEDAVECWEARLRCIVKLWMWCCPQLAESAGVTPNQVTLALLENNADTLSVIGNAGTATSNAAQQHALQQVALPCLRFMQELMAPVAPAPAVPTGAVAPVVVSPPTTVEKAKESSAEKTPPPPSQPTQSLSSVAAETAVLDLGAWLAGRVQYADWRRLAPPAVAASAPAPAPAPTPPIPEETEATVVIAVRDRMPAWAGPLSVHDRFLAEKYACKWKRKVMYSHGMRPLNLAGGSWLRPVIFDASSKRARDTACQLTKELCHGYERTKAVIILLTSFLPEVGAAGESSEQFLQLYQSLISEAPWKQFLALRGVLQQLADLMTKEIEHLHRLEETTLTSDLSQGYALKRLTELLALLLEEQGTRRAYKGRLVGAVLGGYLSLRRLVVQRTRLTDDTQEKLLELLEEMTTGTEAETAEFMAVCIETVQKYPLHDYRTPVFIFERLCSIIYPEENDVGEFFLTLEKDPQQEDFLQGRMLGNPYSSLEPGLGPLMRDVKNKICADCELVALLEDDNGMELLVCNKIMSLDLPVKDVYKKVWCAGGEGGDAMRVVYRMRGLLGDATEEFVESLTGAAGGSGTDADGADDDETTYRLAGALADCGGIECMLARLRGVKRVAAARALCAVLLRLASLCARVRRCLRVLTRGEVQAVPALLGALQLAVDDEHDHARPALTSQLLEIMERILSVAASESLESFLHFSLTFGGPEYVQALLSCTECPGIRSNPIALGHLTRVLAALVYGNDLKMALLCAHFKDVLDFNKFDEEHKAEDEFRLELFCVLCANIERNAIGGTLKDYLISLGIVKDALDYIIIYAPCVKPTLLRTDSDELKEFISRPALKYILRFLTGLATEHEPTQMAVCGYVIPIVHRLEQVSSDEHVGSLAENLLEALRSHPDAAKRVQEARDYTRQEKKRLAMAMREKQLGALGMRTNEKGQVTAAQCSLVHQVQELGDETGLVCCICREGYKYQPTKVLGIYTFTKRCGVDEFEARARKTLGYTTVSHFNVVHVECHMAAVRLARARDEWESAALQNASTRCNGLLPLWGPHVPESAFANCLARHNTYLQECTSHRDLGYQLTVHDMKLLLLRFARGRTFHDDTGGGGPLSNMQLVPALMHLALYVMNTTRTASREVTALSAASEWGPVRRLESAHDAEGPLYYAAMALLVHPPDKWRETKLEHIRRMILTGHCRAISPKGPALRSLAADQRAARPWAAYKPYMVFLAIIQMLYDVMFKHVTATSVEQWPVKLAEAIRHGDESCQRSAERMVATLTDELLPCTSLAEFCDAAGLLADMPEPEAFVDALLNEQP